MLKSRAPGFTLIEVVVALTLLAFGLLAVASGLAAVARMLSEGRALSESAALAEQRFARVQAEGCGAPGSETHGRFVVSWNGLNVPHGRIVTVTVRRSVRLGVRVDTLTFFQPCFS